MKKILNVVFVINDESEKLIQTCADEQGLDFDEAIEELMGDGQLSFDDMMAIDWSVEKEKKESTTDDKIARLEKENYAFKEMVRRLEDSAKRFRDEEDELSKELEIPVLFEAIVNTVRVLQTIEGREKK